MHGLKVFVKDGHPFGWILSLENSADSYLCFWLALFHSVSYFFFFYRSPSLSLCTVFDSISSNIDEVVSINTSQTTLLRWLTFLLGYQTVVLTVSPSSDASICSRKASPPLGNSDHVFVSVLIKFPSYSRRDALFHRIAHDYSPADWDGLSDYFRDVRWEDISKLSASAVASEFCECVQVGIDGYNPHQKCQVKPPLSRWFFCCCHSS